MYYLDSNQTYRVTELDEMEWLMHGFGTRQADIPGRFERLATLKQERLTAKQPPPPVLPKELGPGPGAKG